MVYGQFSRLDGSLVLEKGLVADCSQYITTHPYRQGKFYSYGIVDKEEQGTQALRRFQYFTLPVGASFNRCALLRTKPFSDAPTAPVC